MSVLARSEGEHRDDHSGRTERIRSTVKRKGLLATTAAVAAAFAAAPSAQAACGLTDCQQVTGTVASVLSLTASTPVALSNTGVPSQLSLGSSAANATGSGTVVVVSTDQ